jgi:penicillin V acylase-like amidase (Ntn superfamily)
MGAAVQAVKTSVRFRMVAAAALAAAVVTATAIRPNACTTFCVSSSGAVLFGRNYDFDFGHGLVVVNPRGLKKTGYDARGPTWVARFGSVTFNQFGREFPMGGINEAGLVIELMWHERAEYPAPDHRAALGVLEWIQYQLDTAGTVDDVVKSDGEVRIRGNTPLHYLIADRSGRVATIEFLQGKLQPHSDRSLPVSVLANDTYEESLGFWQHQQGRRAGGHASNARFARAADAVSRFTSTSVADAVDRAFNVLADVAQPNTRWSIVYDQTSRSVSYRTKTNQDIRRLLLSALDFGCGAPSRMIDVDSPATGDVAATLEPYAAERNRALVAKSYREFSGTRHVLAEEVARIAAHPDRARCAS